MIDNDSCETDDSQHDKVSATVEITFGNTVIYECTGEVTLFRGLPCSAEVTGIKRLFIDDDGEETDTATLELEDFPHYIVKAAEKKMVEEV